MKASTQNNIARAGKVFTFVDAGMTAGFGWVTSSLLFMKPVYAAGLGAMSFTLAFLPVVALACYARKWTPLAAFIMLIYIGGFAANFFSNYGLSASIFKGNIVAAENKNQRHEDVRAVVERLRADDAKLAAVIGTPGAWMTVADAEKALERTLAARDREANRVRCGPKCEALDAQARSLRLEIAKARKREDAIAKRQDVQERLAEAEAEAAKTPKHISVAASQAEYLARIFSFNLKPDGETIDWTLMGTSVAISLFIAIFAHLCNFVTALNLAGVREEDEAKQPENDPATRAYIPTTPDHPPVPLRSEPAPPLPSGGGSHVNVSVTGANDDESWKRSMEALDLALSRVRAKSAARNAA